MPSTVPFIAVRSLSDPTGLVAKLVTYDSRERMLRDFKLRPGEGVAGGVRKCGCEKVVVEGRKAIGCVFGGKGFKAREEAHCNELAWIHLFEGDFR